MKIDTEHKDSVVIEMTCNELSGYGITFRSMSLSDDHTRVMLHDMLSVLEHMGLRAAGEKTTVECAPSADGGCVLVVGRGEVFWFPDADAVLHAHCAGVLPEGITETRTEGAAVGLRWGRPLTDHERGLLSEYTAA